MFPAGKTKTKHKAFENYVGYYYCMTVCRVSSVKNEDGSKTHKARKVHVVYYTVLLTICRVSSVKNEDGPKAQSSEGPRRVPVGAAVISHYVSKCLLKCAHILKYVRTVGICVNMCGHVHTCPHIFQLCAQFSIWQL
jgi:hypothetical protein